MAVTDHDSSLLLFLPRVRCLVELWELLLWGGECLLLFKAEPPLRLEGASVTPNSTIVWTSSNLRAFFAFFPGKDDEKLAIFPSVIFHFEDVFI